MLKTNRLLLFITLILLGGCHQTDSRHDVSILDASILDSERFPRPIALTVADIEWFRHFGVAWIFSENGAPTMILPGLNLNSHSELFEGDAGAQAIIYDFERVFTAFAVYGRLNPGRYSINPERIIGNLPQGLSMQAEFELTPTHLRLIRHAWWRKGFIDFKYPYGNYSNYAVDMALKLGRNVPKNSDTGEFELSASDQALYQRLHKELLFVLQVFVEHAQIEPGSYQLPVDGWDSAFVRLHPPTAQQVVGYMKNAVRLKKRFSKGEGDRVLDWMRLNQEFSKVME